MTENMLTRVLSHNLTNQPPYFDASYITKTCPCNTHRFFLKKKNDIFIIFAQNIDCGYTLEPPQRGGFNEYPQSMFWMKNKKIRYTPVNHSSSI